LGIAGDPDYVDKVLAAGTTPNGVFGLKLLWHQSPALIAKLKAALPSMADAGDASIHTLLQAKLGAAPRYVWLRRRNKLAQAISYLRASRTGLWRSTDKGNRDVANETALEFDFDTIARYLQGVNEFDAQWQSFFRRHRLKVLMIVYENFISSYEVTIANALDFLGIPREGVTVAPPRLERQSDALSAEWEQRFIETARQRGILSKSRQPSPARPAQRVDEVAEKPALLEEPGRAKRERRARPKAGTAPESERLPLVAYRLTPAAAPLVRAGRDRDWMDATPLHFAYRCLPMVIANQHGWLLLNKHKFAATWNGGPDPAALKIDFLSGEAPRDAVSLFGGGVLTFTVGYLFRTAPGYNLHVRGPANCPKDGITALEGIVESDWTEATFTMNWKITRPNHPVVFEEGEPIAMISPLRRGEIEQVDPSLRNLSDEPELASLHQEWARSRAKHNADLKVPNSKARKDGWQRHYVRGMSIRETPAREHQTKLSLQEFKDKRD
jgi:LPS sulfotransferase NodH